MAPTGQRADRDSHLFPLCVVTGEAWSCHHFCDICVFQVAPKADGITALAFRVWYAEFGSQNSCTEWMDGWERIFTQRVAFPLCVHRSTLCP